MALFCLFSAPTRAQRWEIQFFYDKDNSALRINDLKFPSAQRGIAVGALNEKGDIHPVSLVTNDGGKNWDLLPLKEVGLSLFFLNDSLGWMVTGEGIWRTEESGRSWRKLKKLRGIERVYFLDDKNGWAVGAPKAVYETTDGGQEWTQVAAAGEPSSNPDYTTYGWIEFANPLMGVIVGWNDPRRRDSRLPSWMDPERAQRRRQWPSLTVLLQTPDGGRTWKPSTSSLFGRITRLRLDPQGDGLALVEFQDAFQWPSEVYRMDLKLGETVRTFRQKNRAVKDIALLRDGTGYLAAVEPQGILSSSPIPGNLRILRSRNLSDWQEMEVDYRAFAAHAVLAVADAAHIWIATDTGMILKLAGD